MNKFLKIALIIIGGLLVIGIAGVWYVIGTFDINTYKKDIEQKLTAELHRAVSIDDISLDVSFAKSFIPVGLKLIATGVAIKEDPQFSGGDILRVGVVNLDLNLVSFIREKRINVNKIMMREPYLQLIKNKDGSSNIAVLMDNLLKKAPSENNKEDKASVETVQPITAHSSAPKRRDHFHEFLVNSVDIEGGQFLYSDYSAENQLVIPIQQLQVTFNDVSLNKDFPFAISAAVFSRQQSNIFLSGEILLDMGQQQLRLKDVVLKSNMSKLSLEKLSDGVAAIRESGLQDGFGGEFILSIPLVILSSQGLETLQATAQLVDGKFKHSALIYPVENIDLNTEISKDDIILKQLFMYLASGKIDIRGRLDDYLTEQNVSGHVNFEDLKLEESISQSTLKKGALFGENPVKLFGTINGTIDGNARGIFTTGWEDSLKGQAVIDINGAGIEDFNIASYYLDQVMAIPSFIAQFAGGINLRQQLVRNLPGVMQQRLNAKDTVVQNVVIKGDISDKAIPFNINVTTEDIIISGRGQYNLDQTFYAGGYSLFSRELSLALTKNFQGIDGLMNEEGKVKILFKEYHGPFDQFRPVPDFSSMKDGMIRQKGKEELRKALFKVLDLDLKVPPAPGDSGRDVNIDGSDRTNQEDDISAESILIENILDAIPIFK